LSARYGGHASPERDRRGRETFSQTWGVCPRADTPARTPLAGSAARVRRLWTPRGATRHCLSSEL
jgi:hypothetical protein